MPPPLLADNRNCRLVEVLDKRSELFVQLIHVRHILIFLVCSQALLMQILHSGAPSARKSGVNNRSANLTTYYRILQLVMLSLKTRLLLIATSLLYCFS